MALKKGESVRETKDKGYLAGLPEPFVKALNEIAEMREATAPLIKEYKVLGKPLPQILDEMDDNIRAAAEAARKSEDASRAAKEAAAFGTKAFVEAEKQAEKTRIAGVKANTSMLKRIQSLEKRLANIEASLPSEKVILLREISKEDAKKEIRKIFSEGKTLYYSDIAERLNLDLQLVVEICNKLQKSGEIEIGDNIQKSR